MSCSLLTLSQPSWGLVMRFLLLCILTLEIAKGCCSRQVKVALPCHVGSASWSMLESVVELDLRHHDLWLAVNQLKCGNVPQDICELHEGHEHFWCCYLLLLCAESWTTEPHCGWLQPALMLVILDSATPKTLQQQVLVQPEAHPPQDAGTTSISKINWSRALCLSTKSLSSCYG